MAVGLLQAAPPGRVVVVVGAGSPGGVTVRLKVPCAPAYPSTTMKYVCPAVTVGVMREARFKPVALAHASSLHPAATSGALVPLVVPLKVPPGAGMAVGLLQVPPPGRVVVVVGTGSAGGVTVRLKVPCAPPYPSTTMKYVCPAVTVGVMREARNRPVALGQVSSLHPAATSGPPEHTPLRR